MSSISVFSSAWTEFGMETFDGSENRSRLKIDAVRGLEYRRFASDPIRNIKISANDIL